MDAKKIESASLLDLVFEGRNKDYGAYELRTGYNTRLRNALLLTTLIALLLLTASFISSLDLGGKKGQVIIKEVQLEEIKQDKSDLLAALMNKLSHRHHHHLSHQSLQRLRWPSSPHPKW